MKHSTTNSTGKAPVAKKQRKAKAKAVAQAQEKAEIASKEQTRAFDGVGEDKNKVQKPVNGSTCPQKSTLDSKTKTKPNSKPTKSTKENAEARQGTLPRSEAQQAVKGASTQSKSIKKVRTAKITSK